MRRSESEAIEHALEVEPRQAVAMIESLIGSGDRDPDLKAYLAEALEAAGDRGAAIDAWTAYMEIDPEWPGAYARRAELLADGGQLLAAQAELHMATSMFDFDNEARLIRVQALIDELGGDHATADRGYERAAELDFTLPAPPRFDRREVASSLTRAAGRGAAIVVVEVPELADEEGLCRALDMGAGGAITVYLRNLERELESEATMDDLVDVFQIACLRAREEPADSGSDRHT